MKVIKFQKVFCFKMSIETAKFAFFISAEILVYVFAGNDQNT